MKGKVLIIDNYDSFTFNLVHYIEALDWKVDVFRNDEFELDEAGAYDKIIISPGPGIPGEVPILKELILQYARKKSILGICLGQQAIAEAFGGSLVNLKKVHHGIAAEIIVTAADEPMYKNLPPRFMVGRYHSWSVSQQLPDMLEITSVDNEGEIMSLRHKTFDIRGVQFHPESILTEHGKEMLKNWLVG